MAWISAWSPIAARTFSRAWCRVALERGLAKAGNLRGLLLRLGGADPQSGVETGFSFATGWPGDRHHFALSAGQVLRFRGSLSGPENLGSLRRCPPSPVRRPTLLIQSGYVVQSLSLRNILAFVFASG